MLFFDAGEGGFWRSSKDFVKFLVEKEVSLTGVGEFVRRG